MLMLAPIVALVAFLQPPAERDPGFTLRVFQLEGEIKSLPTLAENQTPNADSIRDRLDLTNDDFAQVTAPFLTHVRATLVITEPGPHTFRLTSDDGSRLTLDGNVIIDHDGRHGATPKTSDTLTLPAGPHTLFIEHFDSGGKRALHLQWRTPSATDFTTITATNLTTDRDNARVVAPGIKSLRSPRRAGDGRPIETAHPSFTIEPIVVTGFDPMIGAMTLAQDGRLIVGTFNPLQRTETDLPDIETKVPDKLYALSGIDGDLSKVTVSVAADGLFEPLGLCAVGADLYVSHRRAITRLRDTDADGFYESHEDIASGWQAWNYHQFTFGLLHRNGKLYAALSTVMAPPAWEGMGTNAGPNDPLRGCILEVDIASRTFHVIAGGVRTPNGLGFGPEGSLFYSDNQGTWMPSNPFAQVTPGRFYGHFNNTKLVPKLADRFPSGGSASVWCDRPRTPAAIDLVHNDLCNSPTQSLLIDTGPFAGQMLIGELTAGGIRRAFLERINGQWQGAVFQFSQGFNVGINRMVWGKNGTLFVGGIGAGGNWNWKETRAGLERLTPTGKTPFEIFAVRALPTGLEIEFTHPINPAFLANPGNYTLRHWMYEPTAEYGGLKKSIQPLTASAAAPSADNKRVTLTIPGILPGRTIHLRTDPVSTTGEQLWATEAWYAMNHVPAPAPPPATLNAQPITIDSLGVGALPPSHAAVLIGRSARAMFTTPATQKTAPTEGRSQDDLLASPDYQEMTPGAGDLTSRTVMGDARLHIEWFCPPGGEGQLAGNSGVYLQDLYEVQVLGTLAGNQPLQPNEAGSIYNIKPPDTNASTGPGTWQAYDLFFRAPRFEKGIKTQPARLTAFWNGRLIHNDIPIPSPTGGAASRGESPSATDPSMQHGPLRLQDHATAAQGPVRYRNVWISTLNAPNAPADAPWTDLTAQPFNSTWTTRGGNATFTINNGIITGTTAPSTPNTFLVSTRQYTDFELLVDCRQHPELNSGIQIRSHVIGDFAARSGRIHGYQVELDPSSRAYSGGIYDEARRGWLAPLIDAPAARRAYKPGDWNQLRIVARGPRLETWINGTPAAAVFDATDASGHIALQVHDVGPRADPLTVEFRNIRIRELK